MKDKILTDKSVFEALFGEPKITTSSQLYVELFKLIESISEEKYPQPAYNIKIERIKALRAYFPENPENINTRSRISLADAKFYIENWIKFKQFIEHHNKLPSDSNSLNHFIAVKSKQKTNEN